MSKESLNFHIKSGDYFGTLATILNFLVQEEFSSDRDKIIKEKVNELVYLQENYNIVKK